MQGFRKPCTPRDPIVGSYMQSTAAPFAELAAQLADIGRHCYAQGWVLGTSGNFSAVVSRDPLRLAITTSGVDKGLLTAGQIVEIDGDGNVVAGSGRPSAEASLHLTISEIRLVSKTK